MWLVGFSLKKLLSQLFAQLEIRRLNARECSKRLFRNVLAGSCEKPASEGGLASHKALRCGAEKAMFFFSQTSACLLSTAWGHKLLHTYSQNLSPTEGKRIFVFFFFFKNSVVKALDCHLLVPKSFVTFLRFNRLFFWFFARSYCRSKNHDNLIFYTY